MFLECLHCAELQGKNAFTWVPNIHVYNIKNAYKYKKEKTVRHPLTKYHKSIITTKPAITVTLKTTRTLGKTQVCEYVPGKSNLHLLSPRTRRGIEDVMCQSQIDWCLK